MAETEKTTRLTHESFDKRVRQAMKPAQAMGRGFSPAIQQLRQTAKARKPMPRLPVRAS